MAGDFVEEDETQCKDHDGVDYAQERDEESGAVGRTRFSWLRRRERGSPGEKEEEQKEADRFHV